MILSPQPTACTSDKDCAAAYQELLLKLLNRAYFDVYLRDRDQRVGSKITGSECEKAMYAILEGPTDRACEV